MNYPVHLTVLTVIYVLPSLHHLGAKPLRVECESNSD